MGLILEKKTFFPKTSNQCISENIWSYELIFLHESSLDLKRSKMRSNCENSTFGGEIPSRSWPHRFPLWNSMKFHWKYNENSIKYHYGQLILPSIPRACLPLTYRNTLQVFMTCFHLVSEANIPIWIMILIQLGLGVAHLGTEPLKGNCLW